METIEELLAQIDSLQSQLQNVSSFNPINFEKENDRIEKYLSDFTSRDGILLTIASLLFILPIVEGNEVSSYFLIWAYPFFIFGIVSYIFSAKRINVISQINKDLHLSEINKILKENYFRVAKFHNLTDVFLVSFYTSFLFNYYFLSFIGLPKIETSILIAMLSILSSIFRYLYISKIKKIDNIEGIELMPTGAVSPDATLPKIK